MRKTFGYMLAIEQPEPLDAEKISEILWLAMAEIHFPAWRIDTTLMGEIDCYEANGSTPQSAAAGVEPTGTTGPDGWKDEE